MLCFVCSVKVPSLASVPQSESPKKKYVRHARQSADRRFDVLRGERCIARGRCTRMNENGFGAVLAGELTVGETLAVEFRLMPGNIPVRLMASVRERQGFLHVFDFVAPNEAQRQMIAEFWSEQLAKAN
jgi:hypothetical protein